MNFVLIDIGVGITCFNAINKKELSGSFFVRATANNIRMSRYINVCLFIRTM